MDGCDGCGLCCDPVYLGPGVRMKVIKDGHPDHHANGNIEWARNLMPRGDGYYDCPNFNTETRNCNDYENRPEVCRGYPFYNKPHKALDFAECVYWSETLVGIEGVSQ